MAKHKLTLLLGVMILCLADISCSNQEGTTTSGETVTPVVVKRTAKVASVDWTEENFGKAMGAIMKVSMLLLLFMLLIDMYTRMLK